MAFVYTQPRWIAKKLQESPGPGSHSPKLVSSPISKKSIKSKIHKGKVLAKYSNRQENKENDLIQAHLILGSFENAEHKPFNSCSKKLFVSRQKKDNKTKKFNFENLSNLAFKNITVQNNKFLEIASINPNAKAGEAQKQQQNEYQKLKLINFLQELDEDKNGMANVMRKTNPSIKHCYSENFFIGSYDQLEEGKRKFARFNMSALKNTKIYNEPKNTIHKDDFYFKNEDKESIEFKIEIDGKRNKKKKPMAANHPFRKRYEQFSQSTQNPPLENYKYEQKSTAIQEEEGGQFIENAVPGPGSYEINFSQSTKKSMMFTQSNRNRFEDPTKSKVRYEFYYSQVSQSRKRTSAKQLRVGFGRSIEENEKEQKKECMAGQDLYYEDYQSIENKCAILKIKDALNPGFFINRAPRFKQNDYKKRKQDREDLEKEEKLAGMKKIFNTNTSSHLFKSKTKRQKLNRLLTSDIDYAGQKYKTIEQKAQRMLEQSKFEEIHKNFEEKKDGKQSESNSNGLEKKIKSQIEIKHHLVETMYGFRQKEKRKIDKNQIKAYTFQQSNNAPLFKNQHTPPPTHYSTEKQWIIPTYNLKFLLKITRNEKSPEKNKISEQKQNKLKGILTVKEINTKL